MVLWTKNKQVYKTNGILRILRLDHVSLQSLVNVSLQSLVKQCFFGQDH